MRICAGRRQFGPIVVSGCRFAVASFTKRPVIALREPDAFDDFELWLTVVRGFLVAVAFVTYRPVFALL